MISCPFNARLSWVLYSHKLQLRGWSSCSIWCFAILMSDANDLKQFLNSWSFLIFLCLVLWLFRSQILTNFELQIEQFSIFDSYSECINTTCVFIFPWFENVLSHIGHFDPLSLISWSDFSFPSPMLGRGMFKPFPQQDLSYQNCLFADVHLMVAKNVLIFPYEQSDSYMERSAPVDKPGPKKDKLESGLILLAKTW